MKRLLIVGGTGDAVKLADRAIDLPGVEVITTLAGRTRAPKVMAGKVRIGGFGGEAGLVEYLQTPICRPNFLACSWCCDSSGDTPIDARAPCLGAIA
jgi:hypothetical protein